MCIRICTRTRKPCSGAYIRIAVSSVVYSEDTVGYLKASSELLIVVDTVERATLDWHIVGTSILLIVYSNSIRDSVYAYAHVCAITQRGLVLNVAFYREGTVRYSA